MPYTPDSILADAINKSAAWAPQGVKCKLEWRPDSLITPTSKKGAKLNLRNY